MSDPLDFIRLNRRVRRLALIAEVRPDRPFSVTGHSLGGAVANLAALEIALERPELRPHLHLYTAAETQDTAFTNLHLSVPPLYDGNGR